MAQFALGPRAQAGRSRFSFGVRGGAAAASPASTYRLHHDRAAFERATCAALDNAYTRIEMSPACRLAHPHQCDGVVLQRDDGVAADLLARIQDILGGREQFIVKLDAVVVAEVGDDIVAETSIENEQIGAVSSGQDVIARPPFTVSLPLPPSDVVAGPPFMVSPLPPAAVIANAAEEHFFAVAARQRVIAAAAVEHVFAVAAVEDVIPREA